MTAGAKTERVCLMQPSTSPDGQGGEAVTWERVGPVACAAVVASGPTEGLMVDQIVGSMRRIVTVWYSALWAAGDPTWRIHWGVRVLRVHAVEDVDQRHRELRFHCTEVQGAQA